MNLTNRPNRLKKLLPDIAFGVLFAGVLLLLLLRLPYGWSATGDEPFYLAIPFRFLQGDAAVTQEWNMAQTSSVLLMPFVAAWQMLTGGTDGIILFMRWVYLALHSLVTIVLYLRLRGRNKWAAMAAAISHGLFVPYHVMALSYNTMGLELLMLTALCCADANEKSTLPWLGAGAMFACAVLCCPLLVLLYALYALCVLLRRLLKKTPECLRLPVFNGKSFLLITLSCAVLAAAYVGFILSRTTLQQILTDLPWITYEPTHNYDTLSHMLKSFAIAMTSAWSDVTKNNWYFLAEWFAYALLCGIILLDRERCSRRIPYLLTAGGLALIGTLLFRQDISTQYHIILMPIGFLSLPAYLLCRKRDRRMFVCMWWVGIAYSLCICLASNNGSYVIAMALTISNTAGLIFLSQAISEELSEKPQDKLRPAAVLALSTAAILVLWGSQVQVLRNLTFWDDPIYAITDEFADGPAKGVRTSAENADRYERSMADIQILRQLPEGNIAFLSADCWPYLALPEHRCASFSSWVEGTHYEKLLAYWENHPEKQPVYFCIAQESWFNRPEYIFKDGYTTFSGSRYMILVQNDIASNDSAVLTAFDALEVEE